MSDNSGLDIFISICLQYPELNAVRYLADKEQIILQLACDENEEKEVFESSIDKIRRSLFLFHKLQGSKPALLELEYQQEEGINILSFGRDTNSISEAEIELFVLLLRQEFHNLLLADKKTIVVADSVRKRIKNNLLKKMEESSGSTNFLAYRKEGRVIVFDR
ncbi:MAG: hypothetical protein ABFD08_06520 [Syntrophomonas sp.]